MAEAQAYLRDDLLRSRLLTITNVVADRLRRGASLTRLMSAHIDALKVVSSLTLFERVARELSEKEGGEAYAEVATAARQVLAYAEAQGFPRCRYTLERLGPA